MKLEKLLKSLPGYELFGNDQIEIKGISDDSRKVKRGFIFVAIKGIHVDAHDFIPQAISSGAVIVVGEGEPVKDWGVSYVKVKNSRLALALIASCWYGDPSTKLQIIGVTGTKGKTTTASIIYNILNHRNNQVGVITSNGAIIGNKVLDTGYHVTNPEPLELQSILRKMVDNGCRQVVLEATSHGLDQDRVGGVVFDSSVLTNIAHEHLDYHKNIENYKAAKAKLFAGCRVAFLNLDDGSFDYFRKVAGRAKIISYSALGTDADFSIISYSEVEGTQVFTVRNENIEYKITTPLLGDFNLPNLLVAIAVAREYEIPWEEIIESLSKFHGVEGRLEEIKNDRNINIIIDFAHTPDSLEKLLVYLKQKTKGRLISVFGCASERDTIKRPMMGKISTSYSDVTVITAEDPRREDVEKIISEIEKGIDTEVAKALDADQYALPERGHVYYKIPERGDAIVFAINKIAQSDDTIVICGKGHEKSMNYNGIEYEWSDRVAVEFALKGKILSVKH